MTFETPSKKMMEVATRRKAVFFGWIRLAGLMGMVDDGQCGVSVLIAFVVLARKTFPSWIRRNRTGVAHS
jgi:hypothetical protein